VAQWVPVVIPLHGPRADRIKDWEVPPPPADPE
jgi:hypothetical protein